MDGVVLTAFITFATGTLMFIIGFWVGKRTVERRIDWMNQRIDH